MSHILATGAAGGTFNRLEINDLIKNKDQFSLYVQAIASMHGQDQSKPSSHFQLCGIHGLPYVSWDASGGDERGNKARGYCTHAMVTFPTWHRAYVALYEKILQENAIDIAKTYTEANGIRDRFMKAAQELRAPFWDWASSAVPPAEVIEREELNIIGSDGNEMPVKNPLLAYTFHPIDGSFPSPYSEWQTTLRHPVPVKGPDAKSSVPRLKAALEEEYEQRKLQTFLMLALLSKWEEFSNTSVSKGACVSSLEQIHNDIHDSIGGNGHMADPAVAGFDPIFFLHHANVDRLLSFWRALHPNEWVTPGSAGLGNWTIPANETIGEHTNLAPFRSDQDNFWISSKMTSTSLLGYTYPEFNGLNMDDAKKVRSTIAGSVLRLYGDSIFTASSKHPTDARLYGLQASFTAQENAPVPKGGIIDWTAHVRVKKFELGGSFAILFSLGKREDIPEDLDALRASPSFVGGHHVFANASAEQCANCREQSELVVEGYVHLNLAIARLASSLGSFDPQVIVPYLKDNLQWRIQKDRGPAISIDRLPSLKITVAATPLDLNPATSVEPSRPSMPAAPSINLFNALSPSLAASVGAGASVSGMASFDLMSTGIGVAPSVSLPTAGETQYYSEITVGRPGGSSEA
ncbi:unnamed protein product [Peniophora sp. CBMAI 1063]|nr:unnamed protein product [Peniophora sp. CBMAI 1063]